MSGVQAIVKELKKAVAAFDKQLAKSAESGKAGSNGKSIEQLQQDIENIRTKATHAFEFQSPTLDESACSQP